MEPDDLAPLIEDLSGNIDDIEEALRPLLSMGVDEIASKLPLLDKAKLQVLVTYTLESLIFCSSSRTTHPRIPSNRAV